MLALFNMETAGTGQNMTSGYLGLKKNAEIRSRFCG